MVAGVDDRAGAEEKQGFEPSVGEKVEHARLADKKANGHHHVAELGEGGVGEDLLDIVLLGGHQRGGQRGDPSNPCDGGSGETFERLGADGELHAEEHVNARRDHGGGVDQGGDGGGAFHRVGQPDVEGKLGGFPDRAAEHAEQRRTEDSGGDRRGDFHFREGQRAGDSPHHEHADHETEVADAVREEGFLRGVGGGVLFIPMPDEQIGAEADQLPEDECHDEIVGEDDAGHREHEECEAGEIARLCGIVLHVGQREQMHQQADAGDDDHHAGGELVQGDADIDVEIADGRPREGKAVRFPEQQDRDDKGRGGGGGGDPMRDPELAQEKLVRDGGQEREDEEEPGHDGARGRWGEMPPVSKQEMRPMRSRERKTSGC